MPLGGSGKLGWLEITWHTSASSLRSGNVHTIRENADALAVTSKETGIEANADRTKYMVMSRD